MGESTESKNACRSQMGMGGFPASRGGGKKKVHGGEKRRDSSTDTGNNGRHPVRVKKGKEMPSKEIKDACSQTTHWPAQIRCTWDQGEGGKT